MNFNLEHFDHLTYHTLLEHIHEMSDEKYKKFQSGLIPNKENIIGVRLPLLKSVAKEISKGNWQEFLEVASDEFYEEVMIQALVIGFAHMEIEQRLKEIALFVPKIDNWAICDSFCANLKTTNTHKAELFEFIKTYLSSDKEYELRFVAVMLLDFYIEEAYIGQVLTLYDNMKHEGYYLKMAVAWGLSICIVKFPKDTIYYLQSNNQLDKFTFNKAIQKAIESYRVADETKSFLRSMKR